MKITSLVGDAVLALRVPDEEMISINTTQLTMTLGRHSPDKLVGLKIEGNDGRFVLPAKKKTLVSRIQGASFVDTQVWILCQAAHNVLSRRRQFCFPSNIDIADTSETCMCFKMFPLTFPRETSRN